ncbi:MAG: hypothetical protein AAGL89_10805 [Pseudomonadota bacterium]
MTRYGIVALGAVMLAGACSPPEITSRMDTADTLYSGFDGPESYVPAPVGSRTSNDFMRFSTMGVAYEGPF